MTRHWVPILPEHIWSKIPPKSAEGQVQNNPPYVGSGPFKMVEWKKNNYVHLVANPTWWGPKPTITDLYFTYYTNGDTMLQDLKAGTIDAAVEPRPDADQAAARATPTSRPAPSPRTPSTNSAFNCYTGPSKGNPVLKDVKFRQALNYAIDKQKIVRLVMMGYTTARHDDHPAELLHDPDWHWEPPADDGVHVRPREGQAAARRGRLQGHRRRRHPRVQGQAHQSAPDRARRVDAGAAGRQVHRRLVQGRRHQGHAAVMDSSTLSSTILNEEKGVLTPGLRHVPLGLVPRLRPGLDAELLHQGADRQLERQLLDRPGVRGSSTSSRARSWTRPSARR